MKTQKRYCWNWANLILSEEKGIDVWKAAIPLLQDNLIVSKVK